VASVLGRITTSDDSPRGPDVKHRIRVKSQWLERGEAIQFSLPRNLACAKCDGGGCDTCSGAGALSLRDRDASPEVVRIVLPATTRESDDVAPAVAIRIPDRGGLAPDGRLPRGMLILTVVGDESGDDDVVKVHPSLVPPPAEPFEGPETKALAPAASPPSGLSWPIVVVVAIVVWILLLVILRTLGAF
jgi:hypothetical protein